MGCFGSLGTSSGFGRGKFERVLGLSRCFSALLFLRRDDLKASLQLSAKRGGTCIKGPVSRILESQTTSCLVLYGRISI